MPLPVETSSMMNSGGFDNYLFYYKSSHEVTMRDGGLGIVNLGAQRIIGQHGDGGTLKGCYLRTAL